MWLVGMFSIVVVCLVLFVCVCLSVCMLWGCGMSICLVRVVLNLKLLFVVI